MSRGQYLAYLRSLAIDGTRVGHNSDCTGNVDRIRDNGMDGDDFTDPIEQQDSTDKLLVGVCIFRLDEHTLRPAVLLLRRSPWWWRHRVFTSAAKRQAVGEWELPSGEVENDDFCISAAIERAVRKKTGLRVTKVMGMLSDVHWEEELKVLLWEDGDEEGDYSERDSRDDKGEKEDECACPVGDNLGQAQVGSKVGPHANMDSASSIENGFLMATGTCGDGSSDGEMLSLFDSLELEALGVRIPTRSSSPGSSSAAWTSGVESSHIPSSTPSPAKDHDDDDDDNKHHDENHCNDRDEDYGHRHRYVYEYDDEDHDPSLEPAPLSLPSREIEKKGETQRRPATAVSQRVPGHRSAHNSRRKAQMIPYKIVREELTQLNFTVLVDEEPEGEDPLPRFLARYAEDGKRAGETGGGGGRGDDDDDDDNDDDEEEEKEMYEHDALEWATRDLVQNLPMNEDLRRVVFEGLAWMEGLEGGFI